MADGKITIELSLDSKNAASDLSRIESQLKGLPNGEVTVSANVKDAQSAIEEVSTKARAVEGGTSVIGGEEINAGQGRRRNGRSQMRSCGDKDRLCRSILLHPHPFKRRNKHLHAI